MNSLWILTNGSIPNELLHMDVVAIHVAQLQIQYYAGYHMLSKHKLATTKSYIWVCIHVVYMHANCKFTQCKIRFQITDSKHN